MSVMAQCGKGFEEKIQRTREKANYMNGFGILISPAFVSDKPVVHYALISQSPANFTESITYFNYHMIFIWYRNIYIFSCSKIQTSGNIPIKVHA